MKWYNGYNDLTKNWVCLKNWGSSRLPACSAFLGGKIMTKASPPWNTTAAFQNNPLNNTTIIHGPLDRLPTWCNLMYCNWGGIIWYIIHLLSGAPTTARVCTALALVRCSNPSPPQANAHTNGAGILPSRHQIAQATRGVLGDGPWSRRGFHGIPRLGRWCSVRNGDFIYQVLWI